MCDSFVRVDTCVHRGCLATLVDEQSLLWCDGQVAVGRCCTSQRPPLNVIGNIMIHVAVLYPLNDNHLHKGHVKTSNIAVWHISQVTCRSF